MSNLKKNSFVTFPIGRSKGYGIVVTIGREYAAVVYHNGIKIDTRSVTLNKCKEITQEQFIQLIQKKGDTLWYSSDDNIKAFYDVKFIGPIPKSLEEYKEGETIVLNGVKFFYNEFYKRLTAERKDYTIQGGKVEIACPRCFNTKFTISYGIYECIANCDCGHSMVVYDG